MNIGLDLDGVLYPYHYVLHKHFTEMYNYTGTLEEFWTQLWPSFSKERQDYFVSLPPLYNALIPSSSVLTALNDLANLGEVFYITARNPSLKKITEKFLDTIDAPFKENLVITHDKATACRKHKIDYFLDDFAKYVDSVSGITKAYLMASVHNKADREGRKVVFGLREFYEEVNRDRIANA